MVTVEKNDTKSTALLFEVFIVPDYDPSTDGRGCQQGCEAQQAGGRG